MRILKQYLPGALCALTVLAGACKEEGRGVLFEEDGTWSLFQYDFEGKGLMAFDTASRVDQFLLHFNMEAGVVAAASCLDSMDRVDLNTTLCDQNKFQCRCFTYTYEDSAMSWTEVAPKGGTVADPKTTAIDLEKFPEYNSTYLFAPLPEGLYNSDGTSSRYLFQPRGNALFEPTGCLAACGIDMAEPVEE